MFSGVGFERSGRSPVTSEEGLMGKCLVGTEMRDYEKHRDSFRRGTSDPQRRFRRDKSDQIDQKHGRLRE